MKKQTIYRYADSVGGLQTELFTSLSDIILYIENFGWHGDSEGIIYCNNEPLLAYVSREDGLAWQQTDEQITY